MLSGMLMVRGEIWGCTGFTGDSGASRLTFFPLDRAVNVILMFVLGNLKVHLQEEQKKKQNKGGGPGEYWCNGLTGLGWKVGEGSRRRTLGRANRVGTAKIKHK